MDREAEKRIISLVLAGDVNAFEQLVTEYEKTVYNIVLRMVKNPEDAQDITQESFIKAYNSLKSYRGDASFASWLCRIASNAALDFLRKSKARQTVSLSVENDDEEEREIDIADESFSPEVLLERKLTRESVQRGLDSLTPEHRQILLLREIQGLSYDEIGAALGIESGTVKSRIARARKKLCDFLLRDGNMSASDSSASIGGGESRG